MELGAWSMEGGGERAEGGNLRPDWGGSRERAGHARGFEISDWRFERGTGKGMLKLEI
jgi:hypothetical protein